MKYKIEELKDITDSREIMNSRPKGFSRYMMYIIISILGVTIIWSLFAKKEIVIKAIGTIKPNEEVYKVTSLASGSVKEVKLKDGMGVKKGDVLLVIDGKEYEVQQNTLNETLNKKEKELDAAKKLKDSINDGANYLSEADGIEALYYKKYELYTKSMDEYIKQGDSQAAQINSLKVKNEDLKLLIKSIDDGKNYFNTEHYLYYQYAEYEMTLNQYNNQISSYKEKIQSLHDSKVSENKSNEPIDDEDNIEKINKGIDEQTKEVEESIKNTEAEIAKYKNSQKSTIKNTIAQNEETLKSSNVDNNSTTYKEQVINDLNTSITSLEDSISELKMNLQLAESKVGDTIITAEYDGIINSIYEVKVGDYIQSGASIASIQPSENSNYKVEIYIENEKFGEITEGKEVTLEFLALPRSEYGVIKTKLESISIDAKVNQEEGRSYYIGSCNINTNCMKNKKGDTIYIKSGMLVQARIINRQVSYLRYLLEMINVLDKD